MKTACPAKPSAMPLKSGKAPPNPKELLPLKLESRQSIKLLPVTPVNAKAVLARKSSKSHLELQPTETSRSNRLVNTPKHVPITNSAILDEKKSPASRPLVSERGKATPQKPLPPAKPTVTKTPSKSESKTDLNLRRKGSNSNLVRLPTFPVMDMFIQEVYEELPKSSMTSADTTLDPLNFRKDTLQATASTCAGGRTLSHLKSDSVNLDGSKPSSITPFITRSFMDMSQKTDKDPKTPLDTVSLLDFRTKHPAVTPELLGTLGRMSSAVRGSVERRRTVARESRKAALLSLRDTAAALEAKCAERGLTFLRRFVSHHQRLRKRQALKAILAIARN